MPEHIVRPGRVEDIPWMLGELKEFSKFYGTKKQIYPGDEEATHKLREIIGGHLLLLSECGGAPSGFIAGLLTPHFMNSQHMVLTEILWWVTPEHRGTRAGYLLLAEFTKIASSVADFVIMTTECKMPISDRVFERMGYRLYEKSFVLEV